MAPSVVSVRFEHYLLENSLGVHETRPRISWQFQDVPAGFEQVSYEIRAFSYQKTHKRSAEAAGNAEIEQQHRTQLFGVSVSSPATRLVEWPQDQLPLGSRQLVSVQVRATGTATVSDGIREQHEQVQLPWSEPAFLEIGLLRHSDWSCSRISAPGSEACKDAPQPEDLFRKSFTTKPQADIASGRLYISAQGVYEAELNGKKVGDHYLAPGWQAYDSRLVYQTFDVTELLHEEAANVLGVRVAEGWFCGRLGWEGGKRAIWGPRTAFFSQLELTYTDGTTETIVTDSSWKTAKGPTTKAEIYDGEHYDATLEIPEWSRPTETGDSATASWQNAEVLASTPLPESLELSAGYAEPVRRTETVKPVEQIRTPSGKLIIEFGQNLVGVVRVKNLQGPRGHKVTLYHAEVLENGELGTRPLRICKAQDSYTLAGNDQGETWEPRFTFHGFRYLLVENWPDTTEKDEHPSLLEHFEASVLHTDMKPAGDFSCSDPKLNQLHSNIRWGMRGNFLSVPTDCPQRDERLGWTGDLAAFAPTASLLYDSTSMLRNWFLDVAWDQHVLGGVPPLVCPNVLLGNSSITLGPSALWHDVTILGPWALYEETGDAELLEVQWMSMVNWIKAIPRNKTGPSTSLWDQTTFQLGDWLDPSASPDKPWLAATDSILVADAFLVHSLELMIKIATILNKPRDTISAYEADYSAARSQFAAEYITPHGRLTSDSQTAYALAIVFDLFPDTTGAQRRHAGNRLRDIVRKARFAIGTGFAGTPFVCEALAQTGHAVEAYGMLLREQCPSWLYPITMGATTVWERWDSMRPDGSINPGEMTSFNHYAFGAVGRFLYERVAGLQRVEPGWRKIRVDPLVLLGGLEAAEARHDTPFGEVRCKWELLDADAVGGKEEEKKKKKKKKLRVEVVVPPGTSMEVVLPRGEDVDESESRTVVSGSWSFTVGYERKQEWPIKLPDFPPA